MLGDYVGLGATIIALINGVLAVLIAQYPLKTSRAKRRFIAVVILLSLCAAAADIGSRYHELSRRSQVRADRKAVHDYLGEFIVQGVVLQNDLIPATMPDPLQRVREWEGKVVAYLELTLGRSYAVRFNNAVGIPAVSQPVTVEPYGMAWTAMYVHIVRLNEILRELPD
jgi:hypothetical protein